MHTSEIDGVPEFFRSAEQLESRARCWIVRRPGAEEAGA